MGKRYEFLAKLRISGNSVVVTVPASTIRLIKKDEGWKPKFEGDLNLMWEGIEGKEVRVELEV
jgi:hypothetical protein